MSRSIKKLYRDLTQSFPLSVLKNSRKEGCNSVSAACSEIGTYIAGKVESDTNLLDISSEHAALLKAVQRQDFSISEVVTLTDSDEAEISPLTLKILADFTRRTGKPLGYKVVDHNGKILFRTNDVKKKIDFYMWKDQDAVLFELKNPVSNWVHSKLKGDVKKDLKKNALKGLRLAFPTYKGASCYGASVATKTGKIYFGGQYSSYEKRLNIHAEMSAVLAALMNGDTGITDLALVSDKFTEEPCEVCGCCRQFLFELSQKFNWDLTIYCFAKNTPAVNIYTLKELLPHSWSSKKWR